MTWSIASYSTTPGSNGNINGINIAEGCNASGINDAIRQLMADIASALANSIIGVPAGATAWFPFASAPSGWQVLDGSAISRAGNPILFSLISTAYGAGDGSTTFNLPDWRGRTPIGYDPSHATGRMTGALSGGIDAQFLGQTGGEQAHTLTNPEMPEHYHPGSGDLGHTHFATDLGHSHPLVGTNELNGGGGGFNGNDGTGGYVLNTGTGNANIVVNEGAAIIAIAVDGGNAPHNNVQPAIIQQACIKLG